VMMMMMMMMMMMAHGLIAELNTITRVVCGSMIVSVVCVVDGGRHLVICHVGNERGVYVCVRCNNRSPI
jgi:hypothetical protein